MVTLNSVIVIMTVLVLPLLQGAVAMLTGLYWFLQSREKKKTKKEEGD